MVGGILDNAFARQAQSSPVLSDISVLIIELVAPFAMGLLNIAMGAMLDLVDGVLAMGSPRKVL